MFKKLKIWWIKSDYRIKLAMKFWLSWSNLYQKIERKFMKIDISLVRTWSVDRRDFASSDSDYKNPFKAWEKYCTRNGLYHYKSDKWYMLYDVISAPERVMIRKGVDCDDLSLLGYSYFGSFINFDDTVYEFDGFYSIIWNDSSGHSIGIWKNPLKKDDYFMISNKEALKISNIRRAWDIEERGGIRAIAKYSLKKNILTLRDIDYGEKLTNKPT